MNSNEILYPVFVLAAWTSAVLLWIPIVRVGAVMRGELTPDDFRVGESAAVPERVSLANRNYMNLLELPVLFYVVCALLFAAKATTPTLQLLAWVYVAVRIVHSLINLTYNNVPHRLLAFALSNVVLVGMWILAGAQLL